MRYKGSVFAQLKKLLGNRSKTRDSQSTEVYQHTPANPQPPPEYVDKIYEDGFPEPFSEPEPYLPPEPDHQPMRVHTEPQVNLAPPNEPLHEPFPQEQTYASMAPDLAEILLQEFLKHNPSQLYEPQFEEITQAIEEVRAEVREASTDEMIPADAPPDSIDALVDADDPIDEPMPDEMDPILRMDDPFRQGG